MFFFLLNSSSHFILIAGLHSSECSLFIIILNYLSYFRNKLWTFVNNNVKLHFLLDTGSDDSYINVDVLDKLVIKKSYNVKRDIVTGNGSISSSQIVLMDISYKEQCFENAFVVSDMGEAFDAATGASGIKIHGILGSVFFAKYKYVLDYMKLEAYSKL